MRKIELACKSFRGKDLEGDFFPVIEMRRASKLLLDPFYLKENEDFLHVCTFNRYSTAGKSIFRNENRTLSIRVNEEDHIRIISLDEGCDFKKAYERICEVTNHIASDIRFASDAHLGYITTNPLYLGTTLRIEAHIKIPKLLRTKVKFKRILEDNILFF